MNVIKTGMVYQRTVKGPNYICLGKATIDGQTLIVSTKNGNINYDGNCKTLSKKSVRLEAHHPNKIARIHDVRDVNVASVFALGNADSDGNDVKRIITRGVKTDAELPNVRRLK